MSSIKKNNEIIFVIFYSLLPAVLTYIIYREVMAGLFVFFGTLVIMLGGNVRSLHYDVYHQSGAQVKRGSGFGTKAYDHDKWARAEKERKFGIFVSRLLIFLGVIAFFMAGTVTQWDRFAIWFFIYLLPVFFVFLLFIADYRFLLPTDKVFIVFIMILFFIMPVGGNTLLSHHDLSEEIGTFVAFFYREQAAIEEQNGQKEPEKASAAEENKEERTGTFIGDRLIPYNESPLRGWFIFLLLLLNIYALLTLWFKQLARWVFIPVILASIYVVITAHVQQYIVLQYFNVGPGAWVYLAMDYGSRNWGSSGWFLVLAGLSFALVFLPQRTKILLQDRYDRFHVDGDYLPFSTILRLWRADYHGIKKDSWNNYLTLFNKIGLVALIWTALAHSNAGSLSFLFIQDLTGNQWPLPSIPYIILGAGLGLAAYAYLFLDEINHSQRFDLKLSAPPFSSFIYAIIGGVLLTLFVPAGVLIFLLADRLSRLLSAATMLVSINT